MEVLPVRLRRLKLWSSQTLCRWMRRERGAASSAADQAAGARAPAAAHPGHDGAADVPGPSRRSWGDPHDCLYAKPE